MANLAFTYRSEIPETTVNEWKKKAHSLSLIARLHRLWRRACMVLAEWHSRVLQRERLAQFNDHLLADIGLTREKQIVEVGRLFYWLP